jgi:hypothetical protein
MSVSLIYQGLPPGSGLIERVQRGQWHPTGVSEAYFWLRNGAHVGGEIIKPAPGKQYPYPTDDSATVWEWCCDAVGQFPELPERSIHIHKAYVWLPFVLSAKVRKRMRWPKPGPTDPRSWDDPETDFDRLSEQAFNGAPQIAPDMIGTQGLAIRLMDQNVVRDFGLCVGAMEQCDVVKWISELVELDGYQGWDLARCKTIFSEFQGFFAEAATRGEDVLVIWE